MSCVGKVIKYNKIIRDAHLSENECDNLITSGISKILYADDAIIEYKITNGILNKIDSNTLPNLENNIRKNIRLSRLFTLNCV